LDVTVQVNRLFSPDECCREQILFEPTVFSYFLLYLAYISPRKDSRLPEWWMHHRGETRRRDATRHDADVPSCTKRVARSYFHKHTPSIVPV